MITILGRIPSKKNSRITTRSGRSFPSKQYTAWQKDASRQLSINKVQPITNPEYILIEIYAPDKRKADLTNKAESIMDLFVDNGIIADDNWFVVGKVLLNFSGVDVKNPRAVIHNFSLNELVWFYHNEKQQNKNT